MLVTECGVITSMLKLILFITILSLESYRSCYIKNKLNVYRELSRNFSYLQWICTIDLPDAKKKGAW